MNILILEQREGELNALSELLRSAGHSLSVMKATVAGAVEKVRPDIAVFVSKDEEATAVGAVSKSLRGLDDAHYRALLVIVPSNTSAARATAYEAGADGVANVTASARELLEHVRVAERVVRLERRLRERVIELEGALRRLALVANVRGQVVAPPSTPLNRGGIRFPLTHSWVEVDDILRKMCGEYLQNPFEEVVGGVTLPVGYPGAKIELTDVDNELGLELAFFTPPESARAIAAMFTGDISMVDDDITKDVLLELANSAMGAVRAAFLSEEFRFAASTPKAIVSGAAAKLNERVEAKRVITFRHGDSIVHAVVAVHQQGRIKVKATLLRDGMVVATDVMTPQGVVLVRAGTRLTEVTADKIARIVPKLEIELADTGAR